MGRSLSTQGKPVQAQEEHASSPQEGQSLHLNHQPQYREAIQHHAAHVSHDPLVNDTNVTHIFHVFWFICWSVPAIVEDEDVGLWQPFVDFVEKVLFLKDDNGNKVKLSLFISPTYSINLFLLVFYRSNLNFKKMTILQKPCVLGKKETFLKLVPKIYLGDT